MLSYDEAARQVTAAGMPFETVQQDVMGVPRTLFRNAPNSLRDIVVAASARSDDVTFLVYEDERWGFERFGREVAALGTALVEQYGILRSIRSASAISTDAPQSDRAKSISSAVHQALKLTEIAPIDTAAAKDTTHSG